MTGFLESMTRFFERLRAWWSAFRSSERGQRAIRAARGVLLAGVLIFFLYRFTQIGWGRVWKALPEQPLYYVILLVMYVLYPVGDAIVYGRLWRTSVRRCLPVSFRKRVLNQDLLSFSGEVYFFDWARRHVPQPGGVLWRTIKDNLIITSVVSIGTASLILTASLLTVPPQMLQELQNTRALYAAGGFVVLALAAGTAVRFRKALLSVSSTALGLMLGVHAARFVAGRVLQVLQWWVVVPDTSLQTWLVLLSLLVLTSRIPFVPASDLVFVSLGTHVAAFLDISVATAAGMLVARSACEKVLNAGVFGGSALCERWAGPPADPSRPDGHNATDPVTESPLEAGQKSKDDVAAQASSSRPPQRLP